MKSFLIILVLNFAMILSGYSQEKTYYHTFKTTDSHIILTQWRVDFNEKGDEYIIETSDNQNRVKEIRLIKNNQLYDSDCYDVSIIKFEYKQDTIIQYNLVNDSVYSAGIECGEPAKILYILENNKIKESISFIDYDIYLKGNFQLEPDFRIQLENNKIKNKNGIKGSANYIYGYVFSSTKFNDFLPAKENFEFGNKPWYHYPYSEKVSKSEFAIQNCKILIEK